MATPVHEEVYRLRGLLSFWPAQTDLDPDTLMTLARFAAEVARAALPDVVRCREVRGFPKPAREAYQLGDLLGYWPTRPAMRGPAKDADDEAAG